MCKKCGTIGDSVNELAKLVAVKKISSTGDILKEFGIRSEDSTGSTNALANSLWAALIKINELNKEIEDLKSGEPNGIGCETW